MNALTIFLDIIGTSKILGNRFDICLNDDVCTIEKNQKKFFIQKKIECEQGWNKIIINHLDHPNDLTIMQNKKILDYSFVSLDHIKINNYELSFDMMNNSGLKVYNPNSQKKLYLYHLGEPFCVELNFYYPLEHWTFALASGEGHFGRIGWKHA